MKAAGAVPAHLVNASAVLAPINLDTARAIRPWRDGLRQPELLLVYKMLIIGVVSFAFAAFTTLIFISNFS